MVYGTQPASCLIPPEPQSALWYPYYCIALYRSIYYGPYSKLVMEARKLPHYLKVYQASELVFGATHIFLSVLHDFHIQKTEERVRYTEHSDECLLLLCAGSNWPWPCVLGFCMWKGAWNFFLGPIESDLYSWLSSCGVEWSECEMDHPSALSSDEIYDGWNSAP